MGAYLYARIIRNAKIIEKNMMISNELKFLIQLSAGLYRKPSFEYVGIEDIDIGKFIKIALKNNMLYFASCQMLKNASLDYSLKARFSALAKAGLKELDQISKSVSEIKSRITPYLIFKTYRGDHFPRIGNDVDVLVREEERSRVRDAFLRRGYSKEYDDVKERSVGLLKEGQKKIHLQSAITWCRSFYLDEEVIYRHPRKVDYNGQEILIPNVNADFLIHLAHMNFEPLLILFSELLYLFQLVAESDLGLMEKQAKKYLWFHTYARTMNLLNNFHYLFYGEVVSDKLPFKKINFKDLVFPYNFSKSHLFRMCLEKRLFVYPVLKLPKVIKLLLNKDAYRFIDAPERKTVVEV